MIIGTHAIIYSKDSTADMAFFRDVLKLTNIDAGNGWLIFALPPAELAFHPSTTDVKHELYLMCEDVDAFIQEMAKYGVLCGPVQAQRWGRLTELTLPGGSTIGVYQPHHERPEPVK